MMALGQCHKHENDTQTFNNLICTVLYHVLCGIHSQSQHCFNIHVYEMLLLIYDHAIKVVERHDDGALSLGQSHMDAQTFN